MLSSECASILLRVHYLGRNKTDKEEEERRGRRRKWKKTYVEAVEDRGPVEVDEAVGDEVDGDSDGDEDGGGKH